jgi:hypothetical protein
MLLEELVAASLGVILAAVVLFVIVVVIACFDHITGKPERATSDAVDGVLFLVSGAMAAAGIGTGLSFLCIAAVVLMLISVCR